MSVKHVMVDIETLSVRPYASILSIGAVAFNVEDGVIDTFYINVDAKSCKDVGLHVSKDTVEWWSRQSLEARKVLTIDPQPIGEALDKFAEWYGTDRKNTVIWGNGAAFDISILESAYWNTERTIPWTPWKVQCYRTVLNLVGVSNAKIRKAESDTHHNALDDAMSQTRTLLTILRS